MTAQCDGCHADIWFVTVLKKAGGNARMILNFAADTEGNVAVHRTGTGSTIGRVLVKGEKPGNHEQLFMPHWASCTKPPPRKRDKPKPPAPEPASPQTALF